MDPAAERAPLDALPLLTRALAYEESLRRRTEGITWAIWGLVFATIFFMYGAMGDVHVAGVWTTLLWVAWVIVGSALTWALWRTAALNLAASERRPAGLWVTLGWMAGIVGGFALVLTLLPHGTLGDNAAVLAVAVAWLGMGATNLVRATPEGRRSVLLIGAILLVGGALLAWLLPAPDWTRPDADTVRFGQELARGALAGLVPIALGLRQALRG